MIVISAGMPRAGSGWHYNLINSLLVSAGGQDARVIRQKYRLGRVLTEVNCNIGALTTPRLAAVLVPSVLGNHFAIKTHSRPTSISKTLEERRVIQSVYIYRDPRDALLSAIEYGQRSRDANRHNAFAELTDFGKALDFMNTYVSISELWLETSSVLASKYEDLLQGYDIEIKKLLDFLHIDPQKPGVQNVVADMAPGTITDSQKGMHFRKGKIGRYKNGFSKDEIQQLNDTFAQYLSRCGYLV